MDYRKLFISPYLTAHDLDNSDRVVTIRDVKQEPVKNQGGEDLCPIVYVNEFQKGFVMNKTNGKRIAAMYGTETEAWKGRQITLYPSETDFGGETVPCIRVRANPPVPASAVAASTPAVAASA